MNTSTDIAVASITIDVDATDAAKKTLADAMGISVAEFDRRMAAVAGPAPLTVAEHIADYLSKLSDRTRTTYATHLNRLLRGVGPVCDQTCEPCIVISRPLSDVTGSMVEDFVCNCDCSKCVSSRVSIPPLGDRIVSADVYTKALTTDLSVVAHRYAVKSGHIDNRRRASRGKPAKKADGFNAEETAIAALRSLFNSAERELGGANAALQVKKPRRDPKERRGLQGFELSELHHVTQVGGDDPELDLLLVDTGIATGARVEGLVELTVGQLERGVQMIVIKDKGKRTEPMPVDAELIDRLLAFAIRRGGPACDPTSKQYDSTSRVFRLSSGNPITDRRFDQLAGRWQSSMPWAMSEGVTFHYIRHTISSMLDQLAPKYKKRYLRHAANTVTDIYGRCPIDEFASVMAAFLGFSHPLVDGIEDRRAETMRRFGLGDM